MSNYYESLGLERDASKINIKKGYFSMIRKYPPEKFPEEFMEIRKAYETLSNDKTKEEYDNIINMEGLVRINFEQAQKSIEYGNFRMAIKILEDLSKSVPENFMILSTLGEVYIRNNNTGKAIKLFEDLVKKSPDNASFAGHLAHSYLERGWQNKAINAYNKAIILDEDNISLWLGLSDAYAKNSDIEKTKEVLQHAITKYKDEDKQLALVIYFKLIMINSLECNIEEIGNNVEKLLQISSIDKENKEVAIEILREYIDFLIGEGIYEPAIKILEKLLEISPNNKQLGKIKCEIEEFSIVNNELLKLQEDDSYSKNFTILVESMLVPSEVIDYKTDMMEIVRVSEELNFLYDINKNIKYIKQLEENYPLIYEKLQSFFNDALNISKRKKMINKCEKFMKKKENIFGMLNMINGFNDIDEDFLLDNMPVIRDEAKIGRNNPCICGSNKKYKRCCGK